MVRVFRLPLLGPFLIVLVLLQGFLATGLRTAVPSFAALGPPPGAAGIAAQSLGDSTFYFRLATLRLQHLGGLDGRAVPYRELDFARLDAWLRRLDGLAPGSVVTPTMAAFLFRHDTDMTAQRRMVDFLIDRARANPARDWRWMAHAVHLARYNLRDESLALALARELAAWPVAMPPWARQFEIFILVDRGEKQAAADLLLALLREESTLPDTEKRWIRYYLGRRLGMTEAEIRAAMDRE